MQKSKKNIVLTGGHASATAYALVQYIKPLEKDWNFVWIGPKSFIEGKKVEGLENEAFKSLGVRIFSLDTGRFQRKFTFWTIPSLLKIPQGFIKSIILLKNIKPDIVLSFGGFVGFPVVIAARVLGVPVMIHEQTAAAGRGNIAASKFANKIAISRESSSKYFPVKKTLLTGNPVDPKILEIKPKKQMGSPPVLFITGGHTGAIRLNKNVSLILRNLLKNYYVIHQTGKLDYAKFKKVQEKLPPTIKKRYEIHQTIASENWPDTLKNADIVLSRSGANIVSQLLIVKRPAVLVPLPFSYLNEQYENAVYAKNFGIASILQENDLTPDLLIKELENTKRAWGEIVLKTKDKKSPDELSSNNIYSLIKSLL